MDSPRAAVGHMPFPGHRTQAEILRRRASVVSLPERGKLSGFVERPPRAVNLPPKPTPDPCRPFTIEGTRFESDVVAKGIAAMGRNFMAYDVAAAMGLPSHWTYPASCLIQRCLRDGIIRKAGPVSYSRAEAA